MVVALDGVGRLCFTEGVVLDWAQSLEMLLRVLETAGRLLLSVDNPIALIASFSRTRGAWPHHDCLARETRESRRRESPMADVCPRSPGRRPRSRCSGERPRP
jgi:hypothetical protein